MIIQSITLITGMSKKLHILIIPSWYPDDKDDFRGSFFREQSLGILKYGCDVGVIFPDLKSLRSLRKSEFFQEFIMKMMKD